MADSYPPPRTGKGATAEAWRTYLRGLISEGESLYAGHDIDMCGRDELIELWEQETGTPRRKPVPRPAEDDKDD